MSGIRDARELLSDRRTTIPVTDYIKSLKEQIQNSEKNARHMFRELQTAKRDLLDYLQGAGLRDDNLDSDRLEERKRVCRRRDVDRDLVRDEKRTRVRDEERTRVRDEERTRDRDGKRTRDREDIRHRGRSREEHKVRRNSPERTGSRNNRRPSPVRESRSSKSSSSSERGSEDPSQWKIIPPSEVDVSSKRFSHRFVKLFSFLVKQLVSYCCTTI